MSKFKVGDQVVVKKDILASIANTKYTGKLEKYKQVLRVESISVSSLILIFLKSLSSSDTFYFFDHQLELYQGNSKIPCNCPLQKVLTQGCREPNHV